MLVNVYTLTFWAAIVFVILGGLLGLLGVWIDDFWKNDIAPKLLLTDLILAGTSVAVAIITKWLGSV